MIIMICGFVIRFDSVRKSNMYSIDDLFVHVLCVGSSYCTRTVHSVCNDDYLYLHILVHYTRSNKH